MEHKTHEQLQALLDEAAKVVEVGRTYYHYKKPDNHYLVERLVIREEVEDVAVIYKSLYGVGIVWDRPLSSWLESVEVDGKMVSRFVLLRE